MNRWSLRLFLVILFLVCAALPAAEPAPAAQAPAAPAPVKLAVPDAAAQKAAEKKVREVFEEDYLKSCSHWAADASLGTESMLTTLLPGPLAMARSTDGNPPVMFKRALTTRALAFGP